MLDSLFTLRYSKLQRPRIPRAVLPRPRLWSMLDDGIFRPLTLVCASPGFGKTTLVSSWLAEREASGNAALPWPTAWLSLDEQDGDPNVFLNYLIAALRTRLGNVCAETLAMLHSPQQAVPSTLLTSLVNELVALPSPVALVLDDYSAIKSEAPNEIIVQLLRNWPQPLHLIVITRRSPPWPLPHLRAADEVTEIRSQHLRFTRHEIHDYLRQMFAGPVEDSAVTAYEQQSEGWIAGIKLAALAARDGETTWYASGSPPSSGGTIAEYLVDEVMATQPWPVQQFLMETSILEHFSVPLAQAVMTGHEAEWDAAACVANLFRADLFIVALDPGNEWYRYHHLLRDFLLRQLHRSVSAEKIGDLHRCAARWFAQQDLVEPAVHHALQAQDLRLASSLLGQAIYGALNRDDRVTLDRWLSWLPEDYVQERPELLLLRVMSLQFAWQLSAQQHLIPTIEALLEREEAETGESQILRGMHAQLSVIRSQHAYFALDFQGAIQECEQVLALSSRTWTYLRGSAMLYLGPSLQAKGEFEAAERLLLDAFEQYADKSDGFALRICLGLCFMYSAEGKLELTRQTALDMLRHSQARGLVTMECWARYFLGLVYYHWNELETAQTYLEGVLNYRHVAILIAVRESLALLVLTHALLGQANQAWQVLELMRDLDMSQNGRETEATRCMRARLHALTGDVEIAGRWADAFVRPTPAQPLLWVSDPHVAKVRILIARREAGDLESAYSTLRELQEIATLTHNARFRLKLLVMQAAIETLQGEPNIACTTLAEAFHLAASGGFVRIFLDFADVVQPLLAQMSARGVQPRKLSPAVMALLPQVDGLSAGTGEKQPAIAPLLVATPELVEPLTARELEVLMLLNEPLSTKEIARRLFISAATVKRHTINIYSKLGVSRRWDAVAKAKRLGQFNQR